MWKKKFFDGSELGLSKPFSFTDLHSVHLPRLTLTNTVLTETGQIRCKLQPTQRVGKGGHSILTEYIRDGQLVLLKTSRLEESSLRIEAFIQWLAYKTFQKLSLPNRIPPVLDILTLPDDSEGFTMVEFIDAKLSSHYILQTQHFEKDFYHILAQTAILLQVLEDTLSLDHRDLKADNLLILPYPSILTYTCSSKQKKCTIQSPFTVAIVDFGFACLGDEIKVTAVDAGEDTLPPLDPCPKDGRDLFHLIVSFYGMEAFRKRIPTHLTDVFNEWMKVQDKSTESLARRWSHSEWIYLITSQKNFVHPACTPRAILEKIVSLDPTILLS
jgi:serine/threonine protein kinase